MRRTVCVIFAAVTWVACSKSDNPRARKGLAANDPRMAEASAMAEQIFSSRCTACHGPTGAGDGPASQSLNPHPRNFHDKTWQSSVNDDHIGRIVQYGGAAVGKSPSMPANPDLQDKPLVVQALVKKVRAFGAN
jgi:mono/diheme cytochrome c family protein